MSAWRKCIVAAVLSVGVGVPATVAQGDVVIGNWENATDGWLDWSAGQTPVAGPKFTYSSAGATLGSSALQLTQPGLNQNLAIKLQDNGHKDAFFAHNALLIDVTLPATTVSGWSQIYEFAVNAQGFNFQGLTPSPVPGAQWGWGAGGGGAQTHTVTFDYSRLLDGNAANGEIAPSAGWVEFIFSTNNDGAHPTYLFDNARLALVPEPASLSLLALPAVALLKRRRA